MHEALQTIEVSDSFKVTVIAQVALYITSVWGLTQLKMYTAHKKL